MINDSILFRVEKCAVYRVSYIVYRVSCTVNRESCLWIVYRVRGSCTVFVDRRDARFCVSTDREKWGKGAHGETGKPRTS
jgi:hypothetical protein